VASGGTTAAAETGAPSRLGVDTGGTFTDFVVVDGGQRVVRIGKQLSTPAEPARAVLDGTDALLRNVDTLEDYVVGTTLASNTLLERKGLPTVLITTKGFRDVVLIGRQKRYDIYDLQIEKPKPLVRRRDIYEVAERVRADGSVALPLDDEEVRSLADVLARGGAAAVAVCLLHAYANPAHELRIRDVLAEALPGVPVSLSCEVAPQWREYERTSTTVVNAYVSPVVGAYLDRLASDLGGKGLRNALLVMQSNGGVASVSTVQRYPVRLVESGPAAGAIMAAQVGSRAGLEHVLSLDIGGTTAKLCLLQNCVPSVTDTFEVDRHAMKKNSGLVISLPAIDMIEIGAGGGSIARISNIGLLNVGPESSGADPGPVCYGRGGSEPTVTDADLTLGYLNPDFFSGGAIHLDVDAAQEAIDRHVGAPAGLDVTAAAWSIHEVVNMNMIAAARAAAIERGADPRRFTLVAFGGAGPVHAARLARGLGVRRILIPVAAGVLSAAGLLAADVRFDLVQTMHCLVEGVDPDQIERLYADLERRAMEMMREAVGDERLHECLVRRSVDLRYVGQGYEVRAELPAGVAAAEAVGLLRETFSARYAALYGSSDDAEPLEAVNWRVEARLAGTPVDLAFGTNGSGAGGDPLKGTRRAYFPEATGFVDCPVYDRYRLGPGATFAGPAVVEERESTTVVLPDQTLRVDDQLNLVLEDVR
jgi:N-methylhydantoinase A